MVDEQRSEKRPHFRLSPTGPGSDRLSAAGVVGAADDAGFVLVGGLARCGMCGTDLVGHEAAERRYVCGNCGMIRVAATGLEAAVVGQALAVIRMPTIWPLLAQLGAVDAEEPPPSMTLAEWWVAEPVEDQRMLLRAMIHHVRVAPGRTAEFTPNDVDRLTIVWRLGGWQAR
jgi:hypothetical protein